MNKHHVSEPYKQYQTNTTKGLNMDVRNRKPYRTAEQKDLAKKTAVRGKDTVLRSNAPVSFHKRIKNDH